MRCVDVQNKIYSITLGELTYGELKELSQSDEAKLNSLLMFYKPSDDEIYVVEGEYYPGTIKYIQSALQLGPDRIEKMIPQLRAESSRQILGILQRVLKQRNVLPKTAQASNNPSCRFISIDGDIVQIAKIISVKKYRETSIDILTTGRNASIRKTYPNTSIRDFELDKLKKLLLETA